jgi:hypothetical protein
MATAAVLRAPARYLTDVPSLLAEWDHERNTRPVAEITCGSHERAHWRCSVCKHRWQTDVHRRTDRNPSGCPACAKRIPVENTLRVRSPELSRQWDAAKNGPLTPDLISYGNSTIRVWWLCEAFEHSWAATVRNRYLGHTGCPGCKNRAPNNVAAAPELAARWRGPLSGYATTEDTLINSRMRVWWACPACNETYLDRVCNQVKELWHPGCQRSTRPVRSHAKLGLLSHDVAVAIARRVATAKRVKNVRHLYLLYNDEWGVYKIGVTFPGQPRLLGHLRHGWSIVEVSPPLPTWQVDGAERTIKALLRTFPGPRLPGDLPKKLIHPAEGWHDRILRVTSLQEVCDIAGVSWPAPVHQLY